MLITDTARNGAAHTANARGRPVCDAPVRGQWRKSNDAARPHCATCYVRSMNR